MRADIRVDIPLSIAAEAAVWIARLHGPLRSRQMERRCLEWQSRSEAHRVAFERCTATWEEVRGVSNPALHYSRAGAQATAGAATAAALFIRQIQTRR